VFGQTDAAVATLRAAVAILDELEHIDAEVARAKLRQLGADPLTEDG
jgi:hypothetical protein